jgi:hypothetical protein
LPDLLPVRLGQHLVLLHLLLQLRASTLLEGQLVSYSLDPVLCLLGNQIHVPTVTLPDPFELLLAELLGLLQLNVKGL